MIIDFLLNFLLLIVGSVFSILPSVSTLPTIAGFDIDTFMVNGMGMLNTYFTTFWPVAIMFQGFLALMLYYILKMGLRFFLGHRAPGHV